MGIAMGLVSIGVIGSLCNMSKFAMIMCILAWVALVISWLSFGLHMSISVFLDDTCYKTDIYLTSTDRNMEGLDQLLKCPDSTVFGDIHTATFKSVNAIRTSVNDKDTGLPSLGLATLPGETNSDIYKTPYAKLSAASAAFIARNNATSQKLKAIGEGPDTPARKQRADGLLKMVT